MSETMKRTLAENEAALRHVVAYDEVFASRFPATREAVASVLDELTALRRYKAAVEAMERLIREGLSVKCWQYASDPDTFQFRDGYDAVTDELPTLLEAIEAVLEKEGRGK